MRPLRMLGAVFDSALVRMTLLVWVLLIWWWSEGESPLAHAAVLVFAVGGVVLARRDRIWSRFVRSIEWRGDEFAKLISYGAMVGVLSSSAVISVLALAGWYRPSAWTFRPGHLLAMCAFFLALAVLEGSTGRGLLLPWIARRIGALPAIAVSAAVFGLLHLPNPNADAMGVAGTAAAGVFLGAAYVRYRSIWVPIGIHWTWNLFEGPVYGAPVSGLRLPALVDARIDGPRLWTGGDFGPEAGLVAILTLGLIGGYLVHRVASSGISVRVHEPRELLLAEAPSSDR